MSRVVDRRCGEFRIEGEGGRVVGISYGRRILNEKSERLVKQRRAKGVLPKTSGEIFSLVSSCLARGWLYIYTVDNCFALWFLIRVFLVTY